MSKWEPVPGHPEYEASRDGQVRNAKTKRVLKPTKNRHGYLWVGLWAKGVKKSRFIQGIIAETFKGPRPNGLEANHEDGNKENNRASNLKWMTPKKNIEHSIRNGLRSRFRRGESNPSAKLTEAIVRQVLQLSATMKQRHVAKLLRLSPQQVNRIVNRKTWSHIHATPNPKPDSCTLAHSA